MNKHILVIDDEPGHPRPSGAVPRIGEAIGSHVRRIGVGSAGECGDATTPDLIISDLQLEDEDGLEMIANLKKELPDVHVILLTGVLFDPQVVRENLSKKVSCYLEKTSSLAKILEAVKRLLGQ